MNKDNLKTRLNDTVNAIKANSKDANLTEMLISDLLSLKGQIEHEPTLVNILQKDVIEKYEGETFRMSVMRDGSTIYHVKGGMDIICQPNLASLNETIRSLVSDSKRVDEMSDEEKDFFKAELEASAYVLNVPMIAFSDADFMFDTAKSVVRFLRSKFENALKQDLQQETTKEDRQFEDAVMSIEGLKNEMDAKQNQNKTEG